MKELTPQTANTHNKVRKLKRDWIVFRKYWALIHPGAIYIAAQIKGDPATAQIKIPKKTFEKIINFYLKG